MTGYRDPRHGSWPYKFRCAARGIAWSVRSQANFVIHFSVAAAVVIAGVALSVSWIEWCLLVLSIAMVLAAELFNTAIEHLARAVTREYHDQLRDALDISSGAVLAAALGAAIVGAIVFLNRLAAVIGWW